MGQSSYQPEGDGFNIHGGESDLRDKLWEFLTKNESLDACRHCLGYVGNKQQHHQLTNKDTRDARSQPISRKADLNKATLAKESLKYFGRRATEVIMGRRRW